MRFRKISSTKETIFSCHASGSYITRMAIDGNDEDNSEGDVDRMSNRYELEFVPVKFVKASL